MKHFEFIYVEIILLAVFSIGLGFILGAISVSELSRDSAIKAGVAEYYLDVDNNKQFRFKECDQ